MKGEEIVKKVKYYAILAIIFIIGCGIGFGFRGFVDANKQLQLDKDKTEIRLRAEQVDDILVMGIKV